MDGVLSSPVRAPVGRIVADVCGKLDSFTSM